MSFCHSHRWLYIYPYLPLLALNSEAKSILPLDDLWCLLDLHLSQMKNLLKEINQDLKSEARMFRILQGDVGSGKTIVAMLAIANAIESKYQTAFMGPTEILTRQHYEFAKLIFKRIEIKIEYLRHSDVLM